MINYLQEYVKFKSIWRRRLRHIILLGDIKIFSIKRNDLVFQGKGPNDQALASHRSWVRLGSLLALIGYMTQMACQFLIVSGLWMLQVRPLRAMERENSRNQYPAIGEADASQWQESIARQESLTLAMKEGKIGPRNIPAEEFWRGREPSRRLEQIKADIDKIKKNILSYKNNLIEVIDTENYKHILKPKECENDLIQYLIDRHKGQLINDFDTKEMWGKTDSGVIVFSRKKTNYIAVKQFKGKDIGNGLKELLYSLIALNINPSAQELRMTRVYDAVFYPENCLNVIMEGANTHDIHYFLSTNLANDVLKACAHYLAIFHIKNYLNQSKITDRRKYIKHVAQAFHTLKSNPFKEETGTPLFCWLTGAQLTDIDPDNITSSNIIRLLSKDEQERCYHLVERSIKNFQKNCGEIFRYLNVSSCEKKEPYFLTITHGDAHCNNFFYDDDSNIQKPLDSFYRISMIDFASIIRTYGDIGDPAEDVGRFLGSLWNWGVQNTPELEVYEQIMGFQNQFIKFYLGKVIENTRILKKIQIDNFNKIFSDNCNFYKLRFYKLIFNSKVDSNIKKKILRFWIKENAGLEREIYQPNIPKKEVEDRPWIPIENEKTIIKRLPSRIEGFIESSPEGSDKSYLTLLWSNLQNTGSATLSAKAIAGMGGIGKTSLALEYAYEAFDNRAYHLIYWILSETGTSLLKSYRNLLLDLNVPIKGKNDDEVIKLVKQHIPPRNNKCLLIYDNVPDPDFLKNKIPENAHILMTARSQGWDNPIILDVFRPKEAVQYLLRTAGLEDNKENAAVALELAEELGYFPLALSMAAHYIQLVGGHRVSKDMFAQYLKEFKEEPSVCCEDRQDYFNEVEMNYENLVNKTFRMSQKKISKLAKKLVIYIAYLHSNDIPKEIFTKYLANHQSIKEDLVEEAIEQLSQYSLIKKQSNNFFDIHRLVQMVVRNQQGLGDLGQQKKPLLNIVPVFIRLFENNLEKDAQIHKLLNYLPHFLCLIQHSGLLETYLQEVGTLKRIGMLLYGTLLYQNDTFHPDIGRLNIPTPDSKSKNFEAQKKLTSISNKFENVFHSLAVDDNFSKWLQQTIREKHAVFKCTVAEMYWNGFFVNRDYKKAILWLTEAATQGYGNAQYYLGLRYVRDAQSYPEFRYERSKEMLPNISKAVEWLTKAAEQGHGDAQFTLGWIWTNSMNDPRRDFNAAKYYAKAAKQGHRDAQFELGRMYANGYGVSRSNLKAVKWFKKAARQGHKDAQYNLDAIYKNYLGIRNSDPKAIKWLMKMAEQGDASAQCDLGVTYANGRGVIRNYFEAVKWLIKSATQGFPAAQFNLGGMYSKGLGVPQSASEAFKWYIKSAEQGNTKAQNILGWMDGGDLSIIERTPDTVKWYDLGIRHLNGEGVKQSVTEALHWFTLAANQGNVEAQYHLGAMYLHGQGIEPSEVQAHRWFTVASAHKGEPQSQCNLGLMYLNGEVVEQSDTEAIRWLTLAANHGNVEAQYHLGAMYFHGQGIEPSEVQAHRWFTVASAHDGEPQSQYNLGLMYLNGEIIEQSDIEALHWFTLAANHGNVEAQYHLGAMYAEGRGLEKDATTATKWYIMAANQGHTGTQFNLKLIQGEGEEVAKNDTQAIGPQPQATTQSTFGWIYSIVESVLQSTVDAVTWFSKEV